MGVVHRAIGTGDTHKWEGVAAETYDRGDAAGGSRHVLIGRRDGASNFSLRYFEIAPGGQSSLDVHPHDHGVYILRGKARVLLGSETVTVGAGDVLYIPPNEQHQLKNIGEEPLGFLCAAPPGID